MAHDERIAIYPGSFDPLTNGHADLIRRSIRLFDRVVIALLVNARKQPLFSLEERVGMIREVFKDEPRVAVETFDGLLVEYARRRRASAIIRGLRGGADLDYEMQMALMNRHLQPGVDTVFLLPAEQYAYVSSTLVKEVMSLGGSVRGLVPPAVEAQLAARQSPVIKTRP